MAGAHHSCPAPSDSSGSSSLPEKGRMIGGSVDTKSSGVDTMLQTQDKIIQNWSSSVDTRSGSVDTVFQIQGKKCVDTRSGSVDTRGLPRTLFGLFWDSVSTLPQVVSTLVALPEQNTWSGSVDTRDSSHKLSGSNWDSVTLDQVVSTLEGFPEHFLGYFGIVCRHYLK
ncbi:hypothetical protein Taro_035669 [Colocasia esculenta]|uniref:Uncharacterized protein n=1 Tax=Colocasia esculenta TaxID=4460 RepID=A0A843W7C3_COLES|nr:hypothetical protein [Colocasia esculenta]